MTDIEKFKALLDDFGIYYKVEITKGTPKMTLIYLTEDFRSMNLYVSNFQPKKEQELPENESDRKVVSYPGFYCWWSFYEDGRFDQVGIFE